MSCTRIAVALPVLSERDNIEPLMRRLGEQTFRDFQLFVCVNQPDSWWSFSTQSEKTTSQGSFSTQSEKTTSQGYDNAPQHREACEDNRQTLEYLTNHAADDAGCEIHVIDRSSPGCGWTGKNSGVGWARKVLFDKIMEHCDDDTVIVSLDADTAFAPSYLASICDYFSQPSNINGAIAVPYYHPVTHNDAVDRAMLRYEIYMRHYLINMLQIESPTCGNPYAFSALGSAMAFTAKAYRRAGGITPLQGGEDYYLMQKFAKTGHVGLWLDDIVYPQGRASWRVPFGTGPAVAKGVEAVCVQYPLYGSGGFALVKETYSMFPTLYEQDIETPMSAFLRRQLRRDDLCGPLRKNFKRRELFVHACTELVDGLRILQYLRQMRQTIADKDYGIDYAHAPIEEIESLRDRLFQQEMRLRRIVE